MEEETRNEDVWRQLKSLRLERPFDTAKALRKGDVVRFDPGARLRFATQWRGPERVDMSCVLYSEDGLHLGILPRICRLDISSS